MVINCRIQQTQRESERDNAREIKRKKKREIGAGRHRIRINNKYNDLVVTKNTKNKRNKKK